MSRGREAILLQGLYKEYRGVGRDSTNVVALNNINLSIRKGAFFGLVGPNGAGKSTMINIIAGIVSKTSGSVSIDGNDLDNDWVMFRRSVGIVPQELVFDPFFTVSGILNYYAGFYGIPKKERKVQEVMERVGLAHKADVRPRKLSGGMRRRLLIAKAMIHEPSVIICDEPTAGLDIESRHKMWQCLADINSKGTTIVLTTHYMEEVERFCDDIALIDRGNIVVDCTKKALFDKFGTRSLVLLLKNPLPEKGLERLRPYGAETIAPNKLAMRFFDQHYKAFSLTQIIKELDCMGVEVEDVETAASGVEDIILGILNRSQN